MEILLWIALLGHDKFGTRCAAEESIKKVHFEQGLHGKIDMALAMSNDPEVRLRLTRIKEGYYQFSNLPSSWDEVAFVTEDDKQKFTYGREFSYETGDSYTVDDYVKELFNRGLTRVEVMKFIFPKGYPQ